jgi:hypothetical protein
MKKIMLLAVTLICVSPLTAEELTQKEKDFLNLYIQATHSNNPEEIKKLIHPLNLKCITEDNRVFYDDYLKRLSIRAVPATYKLKVENIDLATFEKEKSFFLGPETTMPAVPSRKITLEYSQKDTKPKTGCRKFHLVLDTSYIDLLNLADYQGKLGMILGCVSPKMMAMYKEKPIRENELKIKAAELFKQLTPELRTKLTKLIKVDLKTVSAIKLYQEEAKTTGPEANRVIDMLCDEI